MTSQPEQPFGGMEYPSLEQSRPPVDPYAAVEYPAFYPAPSPPVHPGYPTAYPPPYPGYPVDPYDPYRITAPAGTNGKAIGSLVASLVGLLFCGLPSIAGIVLGVIAMRETRRTGQDGYGMALAGTVIGGLVAAMWSVFFLMWLVGFILALNARVYS
jgi:Domain of unknown function (DUF4190)